MDAVGYVYDSATQEGLPGVNIATRDIQGNYTAQGTTTDARGFFNLPDVRSGYSIEFRAIGYRSQVPLLRDFGDGPLNKIYLERESYLVPEIVATDKRTYLWAYYLAAAVVVTAAIWYFSTRK